MAFAHSRCCFPLFFSVISVVLAFMAISTALHSNSKNSIQETKPTTYNLSLEASRALRRAGFNFMATILQLSPELLLSPHNLTIFAIKDSPVLNNSLSPRLLKNLLQYHTSTSKLSMEDLLKKPQGSCLPTLFRQKNIAITKVDGKERLIEINQVLVSDPDMFLEGQIAIHGVLGPFSSFDPQDVNQGWDFIQPPVCGVFNSSLVSVIQEPKNMVEWTRIVRLLSSNGFVSFAIGLHSVLDGILRDQTGLDSVTILAPPNLAILSSPLPLLDRTVRIHILPQRFTYKELSSLPTRTLLKTLVDDEYLEITGSVKFMLGIVINGEEIVVADMFSSEKFVIHGISGALKPELSIAS
ncbi:fasciclin-like arabinogalactan protein 21 [Quillaja saponaria]|uniref:Fasciclin-like arabinogalactan protein 21 n=1 Tax=Quillaja saponaria TaxID=32244 RepID=A0AAD7QHA4_QUISA|nr:fasciclin-like arabinogalactan protein 21 [Quillaja saponaria]